MTGPTSQLSPRDIQHRIRAGETPEAVAALAQVSVDKVLVYATPVLAERAYVAQQAQRASVRRRAGDGVVGHLGDAVEHRLGSLATIEWDAWRRADGRWTLVADYRLDGEPVRAHLVYDAAGRYVVADDEQARWLLSEREGSSGVVPGQPGPRSGRLGDDAIAVVTGLPPAPALADAEETTEDLTASISPLRAVPALAADWIATQASERPAAQTGPEPEPAPRPAPAAEASPEDALFATPGPDTDATQAKRPGRSRGRPEVPSWDEIMFGSQRPT